MPLESIGISVIVPDHARRLTIAREAGMAFHRAKPKLAAFTHLVFLSSPQVPRASIAELVAEARKTYQGPLEVGENLICFEIDETITVRRRNLENLPCGKTTG